MSAQAALGTYLALSLSGGDPGCSRSRFPVPGDGLAFAASSTERRRSSAWESSLALWALARASVTLRELLACFLVGVDAD
jgi:hypothetical protein